MSVSTPIPEKRERFSSFVILSPKWSESQAFVKLQFKDVVKAVYHLVVDLSIQDKAFDVKAVKLNGRDLSPEPPDRQEKFYVLLRKYINKSSYSWELNKDVVEITLKDYEGDTEWIALTKEGMNQSSS